MKRLILTTAALALGALPGPAQHTLFFTTADAETTRNPLGRSLRSITPQDINGLKPAFLPAPPDSGKWAPHHAFNTLIGDANGDGSYFQARLGGKIDALVQVWAEPDSFRRHMRQLAFSPAEDIVSAVNGTVLRKGDVGRVVADGVFEHFIKAEQIKSLFGIDADVEINVDAIMAPDEIYLSFEETQQIRIWNFTTQQLDTHTVEDGAILFIGAGYFDWSPDGNIVNVSPNRGTICAMEPEVDQLLQAAGIRDPLGNPIQRIVDVDGLNIDFNGGGGWQTQWGVFNSLMIAGEGLTGNGVASTINGGSIAVVNGRGLASIQQTRGRQLGLVGRDDAGSLNGLDLLSEQAPGAGRFVLDSRNGHVVGPDTLEFDVGGGLGGAPGPLTMLRFTAGPFGAGDVAAFQSWPLTPNGIYFPDFHVPTFGIGLWLPVPVAQGYGSVDVPYAGNLPAGASFVVQAVSIVNTNLVLSTPISLQF